MIRYLKAFLLLVLLIYPDCTCATQSLTLSLQAPELGSSAANSHTQSQDVTSAKKAVQNIQVKVGLVGTVQVASAAIYQSKSSQGRKYTTVKAETPLAIAKEDGAWYGVLMINGAMGWIPKTSVKLTEYALYAKKTDIERCSFTSRGGSTARATFAGDGIIRSALQYSGTRYVFGGDDPATGMDCSAFVRMIFGQYGTNLPRTAREQAQVGNNVPFDQLQPGDRLYFSCKNSYIDHCGIYAGNGYFVHCSSSRNGVAVDNLLSDFYWRSLVTARRS